MYKALIVDDEKPARIAIEKLGRWEYYHIAPPELATNGKEALSAMRELRPELVFVDMNMPVMGGSSFLDQASREFPRTQYIVISGYDEFSYAQHAIRDGAADYLLKPIVAEELNAAIEKALHELDPGAQFGGKPESTGQIPPEKVVEIIKQYIDSNYCQNIRVSDFAEQYYFSVEYLTKLFRAKYGCTMYEYVLRLRMERAKELLENPENKIQDISERLGYADNHYFSKAFRIYYGYPPTQYRTRCREEPDPLP